MKQLTLLEVGYFVRIRKAFYSEFQSSSSCYLLSCSNHFMDSEGFFHDYNKLIPNKIYYNYYTMKRNRCKLRKRFENRKIPVQIWRKKKLISSLLEFVYI